MESGNGLHEFHFNHDSMVMAGEKGYIRAVCDICGEPAESRLHYHDFKLVFGGYTCQICAQPIEAACHVGFDLEGITDRPVRELVETKTAEEFWAQEENEGRRNAVQKSIDAILGRKVDKPIMLHHTDEEVINIDELVDNADEKKYFNHDFQVAFADPTKSTRIKIKEKSRFSKGDLIIIGSLSLIGIGNSIVGLINIFS